MLTLLPSSAKHKPAREIPTIRATKSYQMCHEKTHQPFYYWRENAQAEVCDCCHWETAFAGGEGHLWCYPEELREKLQKALERRGIFPQD